MNLDENTSFAVGDEAPDFQLRTHLGRDWRLSDHLGKVVALLFYPGDETMVCTRQMCSVREYWVDYLDTNAEVVGISPDTVSRHNSFARNHNLPITLLADTGRKVTKSFISHWLFPVSFLRGVVIIDAKGLIRNRQVMLRTFRPEDRNIITAIYSARADLMTDKFQDIAKKSRNITG